MPAGRSSGSLAKAAALPDRSARARSSSSSSPPWKCWIRPRSAAGIGENAGFSQRCPVALVIRRQPVGNGLIRCLEVGPAGDRGIGIEQPNGLAAFEAGDGQRVSRRAVEQVSRRALLDGEIEGRRVVVLPL